MARRGLTQTLVNIYSPHPKVSEEKLLKEAGLGLVTPSERDPFEFMWKYGAGAEREVLVIQAGSRTPIREEEAKMFLKEADELGFVTVPLSPSDKDIRDASIRGLQKAVAYWRSRGNTKIAEFRRTRGIGREEMEDFRYDYWPYYLAQAKAEACEAELRRVKSDKSEPKE